MRWVVSALRSRLFLSRLEDPLVTDEDRRIFNAQCRLIIELVRGVREDARRREDDRAARGAQESLGPHDQFYAEEAARTRQREAEDAKLDALERMIKARQQWDKEQHPRLGVMEE